MNSFTTTKPNNIFIELTQYKDIFTTIISFLTLPYSIIFEKYIYNIQFIKSFGKNTLIYGNVQSGKTSNIMYLLKKFTLYKKILVVQNMNFILKQYKERLDNNNLSYTVIHSNTKLNDLIQCDTWVVMGNKYKYNYLLDLFDKYYKTTKNTNIILFLDESDLTEKKCIIPKHIKIYTTIHITATPSIRKLTSNYFDNIITQKHNPHYQGINHFNIIPIPLLNNETYSYHSLFQYINEFLQNTPGYFLNTYYNFIDNMKKNALIISNKYPQIPVLFLSSKKYVYIHNKKILIQSNKSITDILHKLNTYSHIIIIANRLASRGLSYRYKNKHITYQFVKINNIYANFIQSLRISGIYQKPIQLNLLFWDNDEPKFIKHMKKYEKINHVTMHKFTL